MIYAIAIMLTAFEVANKPPPEPAEVTVQKFVAAIKSKDSVTFAKMAPELVLMVTPDFGIPSPFSDVSRTFGVCEFNGIQPGVPIERLPGAVSVRAKLDCPDSSPLKGSHDFVFLTSDGKVAGMYPLAVWTSSWTPQK